MQIINYFQSDRTAHWLEQIASGQWRAAAYLAQLLRADKLRETFGCEALYLLVDGERLASFVTLAQSDCVDAPEYGPWIGFVYTAPAYRGRRLAGMLIEHAAQTAKQHGAQRVYINTDHVGLYEKYGFTYLENRMTTFGEDSRIYVRELS